MKNVAVRDKTDHKDITGYRLNRLENKVDKLPDKVDLRFNSFQDKMDERFSSFQDKVDERFNYILDKVDKESKMIEIRFERIFKEIANVRVEIRDMIWKIPASIAGILAVAVGISELLHLI